MNMKRIFLLFLCLLPLLAEAQTDSSSLWKTGRIKQWVQSLKEDEEKTSRGFLGLGRPLISRYTRGTGWFVRPEVYTGFMVDGGYQLSPNMQVALCLGFTKTLNLGVDMRVYIQDKPKTPFFDMRVATAGGTHGGFFTGALAGYSLKEIDLGVGLGFTHYVVQNSDGIDVGSTKPLFLLSMGYNFRFYETTISRREARRRN